VKGAAKPVAVLREAIAEYEQFVKLAHGKPELAATVDDVVAVPTTEEDQCRTPASAKQPGCKRGRIFDLKEIIAFQETTP